MAQKKFFVDINLQDNKLTNGTIGANSSMTKAGSFGFNESNSRLEYFNGSTIQEIANLSDISAVTGGLILQGGYDADTNTPNIVDFTALKGFFWVVTVAGSFLGESVQIGDSIIAKIDEAGATLSDWLILQGNVVIATDTVDGISRLATQTEANDGTEGGAVVITPATLQGKIDAQITPEISSKLPLAGGTMNGFLDMNSNAITNIGGIYTANILSKDGVMDVNVINNLNFCGVTATNLPPPTNGGDAANKQYVDATVATAKSNANAYTDSSISALKYFTPIPNFEGVGGWIFEGGVYTYVVQHDLGSEYILASFLIGGQNAEFIWGIVNSSAIFVQSNILPSETIKVSIVKAN